MPVSSAGGALKDEFLKHVIVIDVVGSSNEVAIGSLLVSEEHAKCVVTHADSILLVVLEL